MQNESERINANDRVHASSLLANELQMNNPRSHTKQHAEELKEFRVVSCDFVDQAASPLSLPYFKRKENRFKSLRPGMSLSFWLICFVLLLLCFAKSFHLQREPPLSVTQPESSQARVSLPSLPVSQKWLSLASENFLVMYTGQAGRRDAEPVLRTLEEARADMSHRLSLASLTIPISRIEVVIYASTGDFTATTAQPSWAAAVTRGTRIELQPPQILRRRGVLTSTLRHEYAHAVIETLGRGRTPRWLAEGLAAHFAGEGEMLTRQTSTNHLSLNELERRLSLSPSPQEMSALYAEAYSRVRALIRSQGEARVWQKLSIADCGFGKTRKQKAVSRRQSEHSCFCCLLLF